MEEIKNRIYVSPFYEEGIDDLINLIGVDQVLYGSDWPHPEGLAEPTPLRDRARAPLHRGPGKDHGRQPRTPHHHVMTAVTCTQNGGPFPRWS